MKKVIVLAALSFALVVGAISNAAACGTDMVFSVYQYKVVGGMVWSPSIPAGAEYVGTYYDADHVISLIQQYPDVSGFVIAGDRECGGNRFFEFSNGSWQEV